MWLGREEQEGKKSEAVVQTEVRLARAACRGLPLVICVIDMLLYFFKFYFEDNITLLL